MLLLVGFVEFFEALEVAGIAGLEAEKLIAVLLHAAVAEHHFDSSGEVDVGAAGSVGVTVGHTGFRAAGNGVVQSFGEGSAFGDVQGHNFLVVDDLREAGAELNGLSNVPEIAFRSAGVHTGSQIRIMQGEFPLALQDKVGELVGGVAAVRSLTTDGNGFPVGVAFVEGAADGGNVHVDEFGHADPHALKQFHGLGVIELAGFNVSLVVRIEVLVHAAVGNGRTSLLLQTGEHLGEPLALAGFPEVAGGFAGHAFGVGGHAQQFSLALGIRGHGSLLAGSLSVTLGPEHDGVANDDDSVKEGLLFAGILGGQRIKGGQLFLSFLLDAVEASLQDLGIIMHPLNGGTERSGFVDDVAGNEALGIVIGKLVHIFGKSGVQSFVERLALPVRGDLLNHAPGVLRIDGSRRSGTGGQVLDGDVKEVAIKFRVKDAITAAAGTGAAEKKHIVLNGDGDVLGDLAESLGPAEHERLSLGFLHGLGEVQCALNVDDGLLAIETLEHAEGTLMRFAETVNLAVYTVLDAQFLGRKTFTKSYRIHNTLRGSFDFFF